MPVNEQEIALLELEGCTARQISERTGLTTYQVRKIQGSESYKATVQKFQKEVFDASIQKLRSKFSKMVDKVVSVVEHHLDENNLEAVKVFGKFIGVEKEEKATGDTNISLVLPGSSAAKFVKAGVKDGSYQVDSLEIQAREEEAGTYGGGDNRGVAEGNEEYSPSRNNHGLHADEDL